MRAARATGRRPGYAGCSGSGRGIARRAPGQTRRRPEANRSARPRCLATAPGGRSPDRGCGRRSRSTPPPGRPAPSRTSRARSRAVGGSGLRPRRTGSRTAPGGGATRTPPVFSKFPPSDRCQYRLPRPGEPAGQFGQQQRLGPGTASRTAPDAAAPDRDVPARSAARLAFSPEFHQYPSRRFASVSNRSAGPARSAAPSPDRGPRRRSRPTRGGQPLDPGRSPSSRGTGAGSRSSGCGERGQRPAPRRRSPRGRATAGRRSPRPGRPPCSPPAGRAARAATPRRPSRSPRS